MRTLILVVVISALFCQATAGKGCSKKKLKKVTKKYDWCRDNGFSPKLDGCSETGSGNLKKKAARKCRKYEATLKKCGHTCKDLLDGGWSDFGDWSECSAECGPGTQTRSRSCSNPAPANGGAECEGKGSEVKECLLKECPIDGGWSDFGDWSECSAECGPGTQTRSRSCSNPAPANGGAECEGKGSEVKECLLKECPIDGGWSDFGDWSECSAECGPGTQTRSRSCSNPAPANGGAECEGKGSEVKECLLKECPIDGGWSDFGDWSECSAECGPGTQTRSRSCSNPAPANGGAECDGDVSEVKECQQKECQTAVQKAVQTAITAAWEQIPGGLTRISNGQSGVWGVNKNDNIYKLNADGASWTQISGGLVQVSSGASVWGVNRHDNIYKYLGNNKWQQIPGGLTNIDVSDKDHVWGINRNNNIYRWTGSSWQQITGGLIQISVGESGVWGVNAANNIYYRTGTYGDVDTAGSGWQQVPGGLKWISSGSGIVVGVNSADEIFYRAGMSADNPTGTSWVKVSGGLMQIEVNKDEVVGTNSANNIYRSPVAPAN
ncbi:hypothetical protein ACHWQZ_G014899 [Mnemiopsis leidyi]